MQSKLSAISATAQNYEFNELGVRKTVVALETAVKTVKAKMNAWGKDP
jgi:hypothetical protein